MTTFAKMSEQIDKVKDERERYLLAMVPIATQHERDMRYYFALTSGVAVLFALLAIFFVNTPENPMLLKVSIVLMILASVVSIGQFLNLLEQHIRKFHDRFHTIIDRHEREIYVLERFKHGYIDVDEIRKYYREQAQTLEKYQKPTRPSFIFGWGVFVLFALSIILFGLAF